MKIRRLRLENWRGVSASDVEFGDGVTIVAGPNEAGKSSLIEALRFLFRFPDSSSHRDVDAVRPVHVDQAPTVELDAVLGGQSIHYAKRFKKAGRAGETTLRIEAPGRNPEQLTGREAHDRAEAMLGEDIDVALWEALQIEQGTGISQASLQDKRGLQEALDTAAGTDSALSEDDALLIDRAQHEYERYFTRTGRPRDVLASLPEAIGTAKTRKAAIEHRLSEIQATADRHETLHQQLAAMQAGLPELKDQSKKASQRLVTVRQLEAKHAQAALRAKTLESQVDEASGRLAERRAWRELIEQTTEAVEADNKRLVAVQAEALDLKQRLTATEQGQLEEKARRDRATVQTRTYRLAIERSGLKQQLDAMQATLNQVNVIDEKRLAEQAAMDGISLEAADIKALRQLERAVIEAEAATLAVTPKIQVTAHKTLELKLRGALVHLASGDVREDVATSGFSLELPGILTVGISTTVEIQESQAAAEAATSAFAAALTARHAASLAQVEQRVHDKQKAKSRIEDLEAQRAVWLDGRSIGDLRGSVSALSAKVSAIDGELAGQRLPDDASKLRGQLAEAESVVAQTQATLDQGAGEAAGLRVQVNTVDNESRNISAHVQRNETAIAAATGNLENAQAELGDAELDQRLAAVQQALAEARATLREIDVALKAADPDSVALLAENTAAALERQTQEISRVRVQIGQLEGELAQARREGLFDQLSAVETEIAGLAAEFRRVERRARAAERLWNVLDAHRAAASRRYVRPLKDKIDALGRLVFDSSFSVDIGADLSIENRSLDGVTVPFDSLSGGAREQLGILTRLAASQIVGEHSQVPLLMDDTLGFTDDERLTRMGAAIASVARDNQIIILTCMPSRFTYIGNANTVTL